MEIIFEPKKEMFNMLLTQKIEEENKRKDEILFAQMINDGFTEEEIQLIKVKINNIKVKAFNKNYNLF